MRTDRAGEVQVPLASITARASISSLPAPVCT